MAPVRRLVASLLVALTLGGAVSTIAMRATRAGADASSSGTIAALKVRSELAAVREASVTHWTAARRITRLAAAASATLPGHLAALCTPRDISRRPGVPLALASLSRDVARGRAPPS